MFFISFFRESQSEIIYERESPIEIETSIDELISKYAEEYNVNLEIALAIEKSVPEFGITDECNSLDNKIECAIKMLSEKKYGYWYYKNGDEWFPTLSDESKREIFSYIKPRCSCVEYVRELSIYQPAKVINASEIPGIKDKPLAGGWILFTENHVGFVMSVGTSSIEVLDRGLFSGECLDRKYTLDIDDETIKGYYWNTLALNK